MTIPKQLQELLTQFFDDQCGIDKENTISFCNNIVVMTTHDAGKEENQCLIDDLNEKFDRDFTFEVLEYDATIVVLSLIDHNFGEYLEQSMKSYYGYDAPDAEGCPEHKYDRRADCWECVYLDDPMGI